MSERRTVVAYGSSLTDEEAQAMADAVQRYRADYHLYPYWWQRLFSRIRKLLTPQ